MTSQQFICTAQIDDTFGPWAGEACRGGFDFTLLFEECILTIPLQSILLLVTPIRIWQLAQMKRKTAPNVQGPLKLGLALCVCGTNAALLSLWASGSTMLKSRATTPSAALTTAASLSYCLLARLEHDRNIKSSFVIFVYLFFSILLDSARCRTLWMAEAATVVPVLFTCSLVTRTVMLVLESVGKRDILVPEFRAYPKETTASVPSRTTFFWLNSLFLAGFKKTLSLNDLDPLDPNLESEPLGKAYLNAWDKVPDKTVDGVLYMTWLKVFIRPMLAAVTPKLCLIGFTYAQPFLVQAGIQLASRPKDLPSNDTGYGLIGAYAIVYTGIAIATGQYEWRAYRASSMMRGSVIVLIYQKLLRLESTTPSVSPEGSLTLFSTDVETIAEGIIYMHNMWGALLEIGIASYLIYRQLGPACAMPIALVLSVLIVMLFLAVPFGKSQATWIRASQDRVTATSKVLRSIKSLKISGLSCYAFSTLRNLRTQELKVSERYRRLLGGIFVLMTCIPTWSPILTFCVFAAVGNSNFNIERAFTAYSLLNLLNRPLTDIIFALPVIASSVTSFQRIQDYLQGKEFHDYRLSQSTGSEPRQTEKSDGDGVDQLQNLQTAKRRQACMTEDVIASVRGSFAWTDGLEPVIDIDSWSIGAGTFTIVLGPVGCGKSTLLKALLGELTGFKGEILITCTSVAYCGQSPWLLNETVRNNIIGCGDFDEPWYRKVIKACALEPDIHNWPDGDQTLVGTTGISMSGGQRLRLSVARALYSRATFLILDDPFSGLDSETEDVIFHNLFGKQGLCRLAKMTIVVSSSVVHRIPYADRVVLLNQKGQIYETGTPDDFSTKLGATVADTQPTPYNEAGFEVQGAPNHAVRTLASGTVVTDMAYQAQIRRRLGDHGLYGFYAGIVGWVTLAILFISLAVFAFCGSFPNIWIKWWAEASVTKPNADLSKWLGVYVALGVGSVFAMLVGSWQLFINVINGSGVRFHDLLVDTTSKTPLSFHVTVDSGVTINRFSQDLQLIDMELPSTVLGLAAGVAIGVAEFIMMVIASRYLAVTLPFFIISFYMIQHFYLRTSRQIRLLDIEYKAPLYSQLLQTMDGLATIRAFKWQDRFEKKAMNLLNDSQRSNYLLYCIQRWLIFSVDMMVALIAVALITITTTLREEVGSGFMGIALSNILSFSGTVKAAMTSWVMLEIAISAVARIRAFCLLTKLESDPAEDPTGPMTQRWPSQGEIKLLGIKASHPSTGTVLHNVTLTIKAGQKVAICGRTGSGKSSLVLCLLRLMELDSGTITIDGLDLSTVPHERMRSMLTAVPQDLYVFNGTVRLNIDPTETISDEEIKRALEMVHLWMKIEQRGGLDAIIHENNFSYGELQLLVFARAMLRKGKVLILDEFTSSLDDSMRKIIDNVIHTWFDGWTVIVIVHKVESILRFDKVAVMSSGSIVEFDEPNKLLRRDDSAFRRLFKMSSRSGSRGP